MNESNVSRGDPEFERLDLAVNEAVADSLRVSLGLAQAEIRELEERLHRELERTREVEQEKERLEQAAERMTEEVRARDEKIARICVLERELKSATLKIGELESERSALGTQAEAARQQARKSEEALRAEAGELERGFEAREQALGRELEDFRARLEKAAAARARALESWQEAARRNGELSALLDREGKALGELRGLLGEERHRFEAEGIKLREERAATEGGLRRELEGLRGRLSVESGKLAEAAASLGRALDETRRLQAEGAQLRGNAESERVRLETRIEELSQELARKEEALAMKPSRARAWLIGLWALLLAGMGYRLSLELAGPGPDPAPIPSSPGPDRGSQKPPSHGANIPPKGARDHRPPPSETSPKDRPRALPGFLE